MNRSSYKNVLIVYTKVFGFSIILITMAVLVLNVVGLLPYILEFEKEFNTMNL